jgi:hypothetical protein
MAFYSIPLKAGVPHVQEVAGALILVDGIDGAAGVDITPIVNGSRQVTMPGRKAGFKYRTQYDAVELVAAADSQVRVFLTTNDVTLGFTDGAQVNVLGAVQVTNGPDVRVPVDIAGGTVTVTADNVGINNTDDLAIPVRHQSLKTIVDHAPVVINTGAAQSLINDATFAKLRIRNADDVAMVAIGGIGVTLANATILLPPGAVWVEDDAAGAAWYAVSDTDGADVRVIGMKP